MTRAHNAEASQNLTPMMQQYRDIKSRHPDMLLLFRLGDFYEMFYEDAITASRVLQLTLTSRDKQVPMAGFPHHSLDQHLRRLLQAGFRVAVCEQVEDPATAKGLVRREVVRIVTPGTLTEESLLDPQKPNYLAAVCPGERYSGLAWAELSMGQMWAADLPTERLADELARLEVSELLIPEGANPSWLSVLQGQWPMVSLTPRPMWTFEPRNALETLRQQLQVRSLESFGFDEGQICLQAAGALVRYLQETLKTSLAHLTRLRHYRSGQVLHLDAVTRRSLELVRTLREGRREGSLLAAIDRTVTPMGARLLQEWLLAPLTDPQAIRQRQEAIAELKERPSLRRQVRAILARLHDVQRLTSRISTGRATPRDLCALAASLKLMPELISRLSDVQAPGLQQVGAQLHPLPELQLELERALVDAPPLSPKEGGLIREGYHAELDQLRELARGGKAWIAQFQAREIARTGIPSLKVGFNRVFGYYIEVTHAHADKVPPDYQRKQTLKNAERYITPELKQYEDQVLRAEERAHALEYELFLQLRERAAQEAKSLVETAEALARLDVFAGLAELADAQNYCRPEIVEQPILEIRQGRHPVLEQILPAGTFVPNDVEMSPEAGFVLVITGPNMSGKSTYIRQTALLVLLAHMGSFIPAQSARIGITDRIFTRVGASDDVARGQSTFLVEMTETANILHNASPRSLVILDEIGRGTSTYDGLAIAWSVAEYIHNVLGCRTLFATHYHELTQLAEVLPGVRNFQAAVHEAHGRIVFLHRILPGAADRSYGVHVAELAGLPRAVLERARQILARLENQHETNAAAARQSRRSRKLLTHFGYSLFDTVASESATGAE
ncbi:MAG: DNA mismatch repair protein MutS [Gemmatales bacterium]|nr:DNA mismatch repair protein MutS [Gemmatales bacterium]MDW7994814.1 DNA mismatch repair protein MutS [Gemmatales bacterium]